MMMMVIVIIVVFVAVVVDDDDDDELLGTHAFVADACLFCVCRQIIKKKKSVVMMLDNDEYIIKIVLSFEVTVFFVLMTYICLGKFLFFSCWWL